MPDLRAPLTDDELALLDAVLLSRFDDADTANPGDEGVIEIAGLDGFLSAIVSLPVNILPSQWLPAVWGDYPLVFESEADVERVYHWIFRHMNGISATLMQQPGAFEPLFEEHGVDGKTFTIVDEWCEGYMRGVGLMQSLGGQLDREADELLEPIRAFTEAGDWAGHELGSIEETERLQQAIAPRVRALHAHWLARREDLPRRRAMPFRRETPSVGRNDPCPCGSGKKFKKCCLH